MSQYDVVVIGSGPGGYVAAIHASQSGLETAIVEKEPTERLGGTCLLRGCIPTKAMLHTADMIDEMRHSEDIGITAGGAPEIDMDKMHAYKDKVVQKNSGGVQYLMKKNDIDVHFGHGRIADDNNVSVENEDGDTTTLETDNVILATGSDCLHLPFIDMQPDRVLDSNQILKLDEIPEHLVVIGAGAVGSEFASVFLRFGSEVTLVEMEDQVMPTEDAEVGEAARKAFERQGMDVLTGSKVTDVDAGTDGVEMVVETTGDETESQTLEASHLLVATGRQPQTDDIGAEGTDIAIDDRGAIEVDEYMRTGEEGVYAIGDITGEIWLAHLASHEGIVAVDDIADQDPRPIDYDLVPMCIYSDPEVASVGLSEQQARDRGYDVQVGKFPFSANPKAEILTKTDGFVKVVSETKYDEVLGMHIIGTKATELISEGVLAIELESTLAELVDTIHPHPTLSEAIGEAGHAALGHPLHV